MTYDLDRLIKLLSTLEQCGTLDCEIEAFTSGEYSDVKTLEDLVYALEEEISCYED